MVITSATKDAVDHREEGSSPADLRRKFFLLPSHFREAGSAHSAPAHLQIVSAESNFHGHRLASGVLLRTQPLAKPSGRVEQCNWYPTYRGFFFSQPAHSQSSRYSAGPRQLLFGSIRS